MKRIILLIFVVSGLTIPTLAQSKLSAGLGFVSGSQTKPGLVLEVEHEKVYTNDFSLPLRGNIVMLSHADYNELSFELHKGFRKHFESGFFAEQALGIGILSMSGKTDHSWLHDNYSHVMRFGDKAAWGITPSATFGIGYNLTSKKGTQNMIWVRPKVYWNLAFKTLDTPDAMVQIGFTKTFKN